MRDVRNELVLCALKRSGKPMTAFDLMAVIEGLGTDAGWTDRNIQDLNLKSVARRLMNMANDGLVKRSIAGGFDTRASRGVPKFEMEMYDPHAEVPPAPRLAGLMKDDSDDTGSPYSEMDRQQLLAVLEAHDDVIEAVGRFFQDLNNAREKAKRRLLAVGL